jgi:hypothetical protein
VLLLDGDSCCCTECGEVKIDIDGEEDGENDLEGLVEAEAVKLESSSVPALDSPWLVLVGEVEVEGNAVLTAFEKLSNEDLPRPRLGLAVGVVVVALILALRLLKLPPPLIRDALSFSGTFGDTDPF